MNILVTGAKGMVGTALCNNLKNIRDGKNKTRPALNIEEIYEYDLDSTPAELDEYCQKADFVFNLAGVNRPENPEDFMRGNFGFASGLLNCLKKHGNKATIMLSSSIQATLAGRFGNSEYGRSKKAGEELFFHRIAEVARHLNDGFARDAAQNGGQRRGLDDAVADNEDILAGSLGHETGRIQHDGFVIAFFLGFDLGKNGVHVVTGGLRLAHVRVDVHAGKGAGLGADALFQSFGAEVGAPGPHGDNGVHGVVAGVNAHFAEAHKGQRADIALGQLVCLERFNDAVGNLFGRVGNFEA